ncbi:MAG: hypothetical protein Q4G11_03495 [Gallicola sp.]|nr:hypothetical protein [Gallicola sp.]
MDRENVMRKALFWMKFSYILMVVFAVLGGLGLILGVVMGTTRAAIPLLVSVINLAVQIVIILGLFKGKKVLGEGGIPEEWPYILNIAFLGYSILLSILNMPQSMEAVPAEMQSAMTPWILVGYGLTILQMIPPLAGWMKLRKLSKLGYENGK